MLYRSSLAIYEQAFERDEFLKLNGYNFFIRVISILIQIRSACYE